MKARTYKSRKAKGTRLEKDIAKRINAVLGSYGIDAKRMPMSGSMDGFEGDIHVPELPICIECKNQEKHNIWKEWEQTIDQAGTHNIPILIIDKNYNPEPLAVLKFEDLLFFMELAIQARWVGSRKKKKKTSIGGKKR